MAHHHLVGRLLPLLVVVFSTVLAACEFGPRGEVIPHMEQSSFVDATPVGKLQAGEFTLSGPYTHKNLTVFLLHGKEKTKGMNFLTLQEALEGEKIIVHETENVNELAVENLSDQDIFIQAGEIVKGGQQDRMLAGDMILQPNSGKVPIEAFCVEQGRWAQRENEESKKFDSAGYYVSDKATKLAARGEKSQGKVWQGVAKTQEKLSTNLASPVTSEKSATSLQLTLENSTVVENATEYTKALEAIIEGKPDVIGYAFAINGTLNSADVYSSGTLFRKLWPALLRANAVEAIAEAGETPPGKQLTLNDVQTFLTRAESGQASMQQLNERNRLLTSKSANAVVFETQDAMLDSTWIHRAYIAK